MAGPLLMLTVGLLADLLHPASSVHHHSQHQPPYSKYHPYSDPCDPFPCGSRANCRADRRAWPTWPRPGYPNWWEAICTCNEVCK